MYILIHFYSSLHEFVKSDEWNVFQCLLISSQDTSVNI